MVFTTTAAANVLLLLGVARAHLIMNFPEPYNYHQGATGLVQVNPLDATSFPFPCQGRVDYFDKRQVLIAGETQLVNFTGGAQHAGGSCQFSISYEDPLAADARNWKAIYTLIGGCPLQRNTSSGNVDDGPPDMDLRRDGVHCGNDSGLDCIRQFDVPIPKELKSGNAVFAWTWFNNLGNREMYMNCAPVQIQGGSNNSDYFNSLPQIFVANIAGQEIPGVPGPNNTGMCVMRDEGIVNIPNPGLHGRILETPATFTTPTNGDCTLATKLPSFIEDSVNATGHSIISLTVPYRNATFTAHAHPTGHGIGAFTAPHSNTTFPSYVNATGHGIVAATVPYSNATFTPHVNVTGYGVIAVTVPYSNATFTPHVNVTGHGIGAFTVPHSNATFTPKLSVTTKFRAPTHTPFNMNTTSNSPSKVAPHNTGPIDVFLTLTPPTVQPPRPTDQSTCSGDKQPCQATGFVCFDEWRFGLCQTGCALPQTMAPGMACRDGGIGYARAK